MKRNLLLMLMLCVGALSIGLARADADPTAAHAPLEGFVEVSGVRLLYLDYGGSGRTLILIHGLADNPHAFDDLAPAFVDRYHVVAYARRGSGGSEIQGPYDIHTLTEDLRGFMDALKITQADLVGYSAGGDEITEMAATHPERVGRIVYFDGGYDWYSSGFKQAIQALPPDFLVPPPGAMDSLDAYRQYQKGLMYRSLDDMGRIEADLREKVVIQPDGSVRYRTPRDTIDALYAALWSNKPRNYKAVHCPALAIYADHLFDMDISDPQRRKVISQYENQYWLPFQAASTEHLRHDLPNVEVVRVPGSHGNFYLLQRQKVVQTMREFLSGSAIVARNATH